MARVWIYDRTRDKGYNESVKKAKAAKRTPPGRWLVRYYDPAGDMKSGGVYKKKTDAEAEQARLETKLQEGTYRDPKAARIKFGEVAERWLENRRDLKPSTWWKYRGLLDRHILPVWRNYPIAAMTTEDISSWVSRLQAPREEGGANLGNSQTRHAFRVLSMVLGWCVPKRLPYNPAHGVRCPRPSSEEHVYLTYDQVEMLADAAGRRCTAYNRPSATAHINRALILLLAYTGLRWSEASALKVGRVDLEQRRIRVVQTFSEVKGKLVEQAPKTWEFRTVPIPASLVPELRPLVAGRDEDAYVFTTRRGACLRAANWRSREFDWAVQEIGLDGFGLTPHKLRHTTASLAIAAQADVKVVQHMLGHKSATVTLDVYGHLFPDRLDEVADVMDLGRQKASKQLAMAA